MTPRLVIVGGMTLDWIINIAGEVGIKCCGGNAMYAAAGARFWIDDIATVTRVGADFPPEFLTSFAEAGIDVSHIRRMAEPHELVVAWRYDASGNRVDIDPPRDLPPLGYTGPDVAEEHLVYHAQNGRDLPDVARLDPQWSDIPADYHAASAFHVAPMHYAAQRSIVDGLRASGALFSLDPGRTETDQSQKQALLESVPLLLPSEREAIWLSGDHTVADADLDQLAAFGARAVAIKLGPLGSIVLDARTGRRERVPVFPTNVRDPTGAGDAYCGGFIAGYLKTGDAYEAALCATVSASFVIEGFDSRFSLDTKRDKAEERLRSLRQLAHI